MSDAQSWIDSGVMTRMVFSTPTTSAVVARPIQIVATPGSGNGRSLGTARHLHEALRARGHDTRLEVFGSLAGLRHWAASGRSSFSLLIAVGGDGTQSTAAAAAVRRSTPFLSVPSGFGNLFARAFGHSQRVDRILDVLERGELVYADVGVRDGELFLCNESFGPLSRIQERVEANLAHPRARWLRWVAYYRGALRYLRDMSLTTLEVTVDGHVVSRDAVVVVVANVKTYGAWLQLTPTASPVDGLFDVFTMRGRTKGGILVRLLKRHLRLPGAEPWTMLHQGRRVSVRAPWSPRAEVELIPGVLPVVVSPETARTLEAASVRASTLSRLERDRVA